MAGLAKGIRTPDFEIRFDAAPEGARKLLECHTGLVAGVAQLVEPRIVIPVVEGSSPFARPIFRAVSSVGRAGDS